MGVIFYTFFSNITGSGQHERSTECRRHFNSSLPCLLVGGYGQGGSGGSRSKFPASISLYSIQWVSYPIHLFQNHERSTEYRRHFNSLLPYLLVGRLRTVVGGSAGSRSKYPASIYPYSIHWVSYPIHLFQNHERSTEYRRHFNSSLPIVS